MLLSANRLTLLALLAQQVGSCNVILHPQWQTLHYPASLFTTAPLDALQAAIASTNRIDFAQSRVLGRGQGGSTIVTGAADKACGCVGCANIREHFAGGGTSDQLANSTADSTDSRDSTGSAEAKETASEAETTGAPVGKDQHAAHAHDHSHAHHHSDQANQQHANASVELDRNREDSAASSAPTAAVVAKIETKSERKSDADAQQPAAVVAAVKVVPADAADEKRSPSSRQNAQSHPSRTPLDSPLSPLQPSPRTNVVDSHHSGANIGENLLERLPRSVLRELLAAHCGVSTLFLCSRLNKRFKTLALAAESFAAVRCLEINTTDRKLAPRVLRLVKDCRNATSLIGRVPRSSSGSRRLELLLLSSSAFCAQMSSRLRSARRCQSCRR